MTGLVTLLLGSTTTNPASTTPTLALGDPPSPDTPITYTPDALADEVTALPGLATAPPFRQFAGYLRITETKNIFYWYVEPDTTMGTGVEPSSAPLTLWTNGGPGCSGLFGFLAENGPFRPNQNGTGLVPNPLSWNSLSHMLYVEIPVGVGFSYSEDKADYRIGDGQTARDNYLVIQCFLERFPHLRPHDLFLTSESYGGHYLPQLAREIVVRNAALPKWKAAAEYVNLKGFMVGNPFTDPVENMVGMVEALNGRDVISESLYARWVATCEAKGADEADVFYSRPCRALQNEMWKEIGPDIDPYALDWPVCEDDVKRRGRNQRHALLQHLQAHGLTEYFVRAAADHDQQGLAFDPCEDDYLGAYLNRLDVKAALHAEAGIKWEDCTDRVHYHNVDQDAYMEPIYRFLVDDEKALGLRILIYSGDDDSVCGPRGTEMWLRTMGWTVSEHWHSWGVGGQVAGYMKGYTNGVVFATVHNAGHEVPAFTPDAAWHLYRSYLGNEVSRLRMKD